jgi:FkbM family methyltransferase
MLTGAEQRTRLRALARRGVKAAKIAADPAYRAALRQGVAAAVEHGDVGFCHSSFGSILDVGASRGQFALFARKRFPGAALYCFEPLPGPRAKLESLLGGSDALRVFPFALDLSDGQREFHVSRHDDSSSLLEISSRQVRAFQGTEEAQRIAVETARLDRVLTGEQLGRPALLKIDVQGNELAVLRGGEAVLEQIDEILVECSFVELYKGQALADDVICFLRERGFALRGVYSLLQDPDCGSLQADFLFVRTRANGPSA